jgi:hypothetical protein
VTGVTARGSKRSEHQSIRGVYPAVYILIRQGISMSTEFCSQCKQSHPGRVCDYDDQGECTETVPLPETPAADSAPAKDSSPQRQPS